MFHSQALIINAVEHMAILVGQSTQSRLYGDSESMSWIPFPNNTHPSLNPHFLIFSYGSMHRPKKKFL